MNRIERIIDRASPTLSVRLRYLKSRARGEEGLRLLPRLVASGDHVVDIGAYRGVYMFRLAQLVGPHGHVHAFEPVPGSADGLETIRRDAKNITIYPVALSDSAGEEPLNIPLFEGHRVEAYATFKAVSVPHEAAMVRTDRLDAILDRSEQAISFIKCDVEGHEYAVLRGAEGILRASMPTLLVEIEQRHQDSDIRETFKYLTGLGYEGYFLQGRAARPLSEFDLERHQLAFVPDEFISEGMPTGYASNFIFTSHAAPF